jgi:membrane protease YdiL (CAAX protease family)
MLVWTRHDARQYRAFKALADTETRQLFYWCWIAQSFVILTGGSLVTFWLLDAFDALFAMPAEFQQLSNSIRPDDAKVSGSSDQYLGFVIGAGLGIGIVALVQWRRLRRLAMPAVGDVEALLPRNHRERLIAVPLSVNAGFSEELFFRLALPLLIIHVTGSAVAALMVSVAAFGLVHAYQGWKGVLGTALIGGVLTFQYLAHGSLLRVMVIHAAIDLVALVVRPLLAEWLARRQWLSTAVQP